MNFIPEDTRQNKKRDEMNFPRSLPAYKPQPCDFQIPNNANIYDRNFFQSGYQTNQSNNYNNNIMENRINEISREIPDSIGNYVNNQYADLTRDRRCDRNQFSNNMYNPITQRDFYSDMQKQNNFLGHIPVDTRNSRSSNDMQSQQVMRPTRYIGTPYNKIE
jgi:hypothetical protein